MLRGRSTASSCRRWACSQPWVRANTRAYELSSPSCTFVFPSDQRSSSLLQTRMHPLHHRSYRQSCHELCCSCHCLMVTPWLRPPVCLFSRRGRLRRRSSVPRWQMRLPGWQWVPTHAWPSGSRCHKCVNCNKQVRDGGEGSRKRVKRVENHAILNVGYKDCLLEGYFLRSNETGWSALADSWLEMVGNCVLVLGRQCLFMWTCGPRQSCQG